MVKKDVTISSDKILLTEKGLEDLKKEYQERKKKKLKLNDDVNLARKEGDLRENEAYAAATFERKINELRLVEVKYILENYKIIERSGNNLNKVQIGSTINVLINKKIEKTFTIVGSNEAAPLEGKISIDSPIGKELLDKSVGDTVEVKTEQNSITYDILEIVK